MLLVAYICVFFCIELCHVSIVRRQMQQVIGSHSCVCLGQQHISLPLPLPSFPSFFPIPLPSLFSRAPFPPLLPSPSSLTGVRGRAPSVRVRGYYPGKCLKCSMWFGAFWCTLTTNRWLCTSLQYSHLSFYITWVGPAFCTDCCPNIHNGAAIVACPCCIGATTYAVGSLELGLWTMIVHTLATHVYGVASGQLKSWIEGSMLQRARAAENDKETWWLTAAKVIFATIGLTIKNCYSLCIKKRLEFIC